MQDIIKKAFEDTMKSKYAKIFHQYYPAHNSTGFTERNLSVNFIEALLDNIQDKDAFAWYEAPLPDKNEHIDAVLFDPSSKSALFVESKRLGDKPSGKMKSINKDLDRLRQDENRSHILKSWIKNNNFKMGEINQYIIGIMDYWFNVGDNGEVDDIKYDNTKINLKTMFPNSIVEDIHFNDGTIKSEKWLNGYSIFIVTERIKNNY